MAWASHFSDLHQQSARSLGNVNAKANTQVHGTSDATSVADLFAGMPNVKVIGVVIAKGDTRHFISKKDCGSERCVSSFILRDSAIDFINVSCWGSEQYVNSIATFLHIGQAVELINACVQMKPTDGSEEKFKPWTPSMYHLSVNENRGEVKACDEWTAAGYLRLMHIPVKPHNDYYTISDIITNGQDMNGDIVSIMAVVKQLGPVRDMKSKNGRVMRKCEVKLFDDTSSEFILILWDDELISISQTWDPKESVIFAADVRVSFDDYKKTMVATAIGKTVITVNPDTKEAHGLYQYARSVDLVDLSVAESAFDGGHPNVNLAEIEKMYTMSEVTSMMAASNQIDNNDTIRGLTYVFVTSLDIDGSLSSFLVRRCSRCRLKFSADANDCAVCNQQGGVIPSFGANAVVPDVTYDIRLSLSDHTGTVSNCIVAGPVAERLIGFTAREFETFDDRRKTELKWQFLLERCKIYFQLMFPSAGRQGRPMLRVLDCTLANIDEMASLM